MSTLDMFKFWLIKEIGIPIVLITLFFLCIFIWSIIISIRNEFRKKVFRIHHLCDTCTKEFPTCDGHTRGIIWGNDLDPKAKGAEADRIIRCDSYRKKK